MPQQRSMIPTETSTASHQSRGFWIFCLNQSKGTFKSLQSKAEETVQNDAKKKERKQAETDEGKSQRTLFDVMRPGCCKSDWKDKGH